MIWLMAWTRLSDTSIFFFFRWVEHWDLTAEVSWETRIAGTYSYTYKGTSRQSHNSLVVTRADLGSSSTQRVSVRFRMVYFFFSFTILLTSKALKSHLLGWHLSLPSTLAQGGRPTLSLEVALRASQIPQSSFKVSSNCPTHSSLGIRQAYWCCRLHPLLAILINWRVYLYTQMDQDIRNWVS